jgi:FtsP/CotA-like multicopper oxidase with cupredoxin domain
MKRSLARSFCLAPIAFGLSLPLAAQVRVFEPPPTLVPDNPEATTHMNALMLAAPISPSEDCEHGTVAVNGRIVHVTLKEMYADSTIFNPDADDPWPGHMDPLHLRSYGGCKQGPLIAVSPGDTLRMDLINDLPADDPSCYANPPTGLSLPPGVGCFNTINLHTHGLHVSPSGNSDNVLLNIAPMTQFPYEYYIPEDHPAGTFWYHAHRHGSTAVQVSSGAAGILVVRGNRPYKAPTPDDPHPMADIDTILHHEDGKPIAEQFFFLQQIAYACFDNLPDQDGGPWQNIFTEHGLFNTFSSPTGKTSPANSKWTCPLPSKEQYVTPGVIENFALQLDSASIWDTNGRFTSVNGVVQPTITIPAGEIQRWRFVHAGIHDTINLQIVPATPQINGDTMVAQSAFVGDRQQQVADVMRECPSMPETVLPQFEIASDGLTLTHIHTMAGLNQPSSDGANYLQPGYRSDILVVFPHDGYYCLLDQAAPASQRFDPGTAAGGGSGPSIPQLLGIIHVQGGHPVEGTTDALRKYIEDALYTANPQLPPSVRDGLKAGDLTPWAPFTELAPPPPGQPQYAVFSINTTGPGSPFQINGASYDPNVVNITRQVNTTDDWILNATGNPLANAEPHIFHIHVNPFEITDVIRFKPDGTQESIYEADGRCKQGVLDDPQQLANQYCGMWHTFRDTVFVENGFDVHIRTRYDRYIGEYVIHCHILDHEDSGMMLNISIVPDLKAPGGGIGMPGMKHTH